MYIIMICVAERADDRVCIFNSRGVTIMAAEHQFEILVDSTCDIPLEQQSQLGITMVPLHVYVGDGCYHDQIELTPEQFYDKMAAAKDLPHSSQPSPSAFTAAYNEMAQKGAKSILSIHIASALSGTSNSAELGAKDASVEVHVWDSRTATVGFGMLVREACKMRDAGETLEATIEHLEKVRDSQFLVFALETLENIVKNGRCSKAKGLMTALLNIKAVLAVKDDGSLDTVGKGKGMHRALQNIAKLVKERYGQGAHLTVGPLTVRNQEGCNELLSILKEQGFVLEVLDTISVGPVIATHTGAGLTGIACIPTELLYKS